jgi:ankyrin repeat protein
MWLPPEDEGRAIEVARLFLEHGADRTIRNPDGMTAADRAERQGMEELSRVLR